VREHLAGRNAAILSVVPRGQPGLAAGVDDARPATEREAT
jgi:hypothetical protein